MMPSNGPMYLRYSFRQPNSEAEFGASVMGIGPYAPRGTRDGTPGRRALRVVAESRRDCPGQRRTAERLRRGREGWVGIGAEITPKGVINLGQSLSHGCAVTAPFAQGSLWAGGCGLPRRFASRNDSPDPLSFRGGPTGRRGNPSFLRWTGVRAAEIVGPYGKKGKLPRPPGQRLAKRKARKEQLVKFDFCPTTSECSTAYNVRKPQQSPARAPVGAAITEQNGLGPRPVVQEDAERPGCTTRTRFFF